MNWIFGLTILAFLAFLGWLANENLEYRHERDVERCVELKLGTKQQCDFLLKRAAR